MNRMIGWLARLREQVRWLVYRERESADLDEELRFHLDREAERLEREEGLEPGEARRRARVAFGGVDRTKEEVREARGLGWLTGWWLDVKLGVRMLVKYPALTVLGSLAMAFAIFTGAGAFELISQVVSPRLPLPAGERVVGLQLRDASSSRVERRALHDLAVWRAELETVEGLGAYREVRPSLITGDGRVARVRGAAMSAHGFRVAGVTPQLGRPLTPEDEHAGAPPVAVIGHDLWRTRFGADPEVIGRAVRLGGTETTVVGVMPEGFGFPVAHEIWVPLAGDAAVYGPREGPPVTVFGRLAPGATLADARAELRVVGDAMAAAYPETHEHLRHQVVPWAQLWLGGALGGADPASLTGILRTALGVVSNLPLLFFLILVCGNVALLMFARAASREAELVVRSALGASRSRIVVQLFVEALVLAAAATVLGLAAAQHGLGWLFRVIEIELLEGGRLPFWLEPRLSPVTFLYATLLTVLAAAVAGIVPGLKVTRELRPRLQRASAGGGGFRFGGIWTVVLVAQIAVTMIFPVLTLALRADADRTLAEDLGFPAGQYLTAQLELEPPMHRPLPADSVPVWVESRLGPALERVETRLRAEPRVRALTFTDRLPRDYHAWRQVEVDGPTAEPPDARGHRLGAARVAVNYFDVLGARILDGRGFRPSDLADGQRAVVVNASFVERVMGGRNPVGQRVRYLATEHDRDPDQEPGPWHQIVGVVEDLGTISGYGAQGMYHPVRPADIHPVHAILHVTGDPASFGPALRTHALAADPALVPEQVMTLEDVTRGEREFYAFWSAILGAVTALALLLSLGGIFAVMQFTAARRTREIGIRTALGATRARVLVAVFRKPLLQVGLGILTGALLLGGLHMGMSDSTPDLQDLAFLLGYALLTAAVCTLACIGPTRRALAVEPARALSAEG